MARSKVIGKHHPGRHLPRTHKPRTDKPRTIDLSKLTFPGFFITNSELYQSDRFPKYLKYRRKYLTFKTCSLQDLE